MDAIIESYAQLIISGMKTIDEVPSGLKPYVEDKVNTLKSTLEESKNNRPVRDTSEPIMV